MAKQSSQFKSLLDWCERYVDLGAPVSEVIDLEKLFVSHCSSFLTERCEYGFSKSSYNPKKKPKLSIVQNSDFGAKAYISEGFDTVEINSGTLSFFLWASMRCVMDPAFPFPGPDERQPEAKRNKGRNTIGLTSFDIPSSPARRALAIELAFLCFVYVTLHEVGHLAQGHCALLGAAFHDYDSRGEESAMIPSLRVNTITRDVSPGLFALDDERRRTLEFMADQFAARDLLIYMKSVQKAVFPAPSFQSAHRGFSVGEATRAAIFENLTQSKQLTARGQAVQFCYADPLFSPVVPYIVFAIIFHFTSSTSERHPKADLRLLASLRACHGLIPVTWNVAVTRAMFEMGIALQRIVDKVLNAGAADGTEGWSGIESLQSGALDRVSDEVTRMHELREELEPLLREYSQGERAFLKYAADRL